MVKKRSKACNTIGLAHAGIAPVIGIVGLQNSEFQHTERINFIQYLILN
jgi:hypothetical protein